MSGELTLEERALLRGRQVALEELELLNGWYPVAAGESRLWWRFVGEKKFSEPFFHDTLMSMPPSDRLYLQTDYNAPEQFNAPLAPTAFVFHVSRCGSTLLTQMLSSLPECIAFSEPPAIDSFLRRYYAGQHGDEAVRRLCNIVAALGQRRFAAERHLLIKLDSWHIASLPLFRRAFPDTPFLFLYREPADIIASHRRQRGRQMVPRMVESAMPPLNSTLAEPGDLEGYAMSMLECFLDAAYRYADELLLINYQQLPRAIWDELLDRLGIATTSDSLAAMKARAGLHSKSGQLFFGDPKAAAIGLTPRLQASYERLEQLRLRSVSI